jgi:hypothetical protein
MELALKIIGWILVVVGAVWVLQGLNLLGGSFMSGQLHWAAIGVGTVILGVWLIIRGKNRVR